MAAARLDKLISASGLASRRETAALVRLGRITVDGRPALSPDEKVDPESAEIRLDGERICCAVHRYVLMNKPSGVLSATEDASQKTVLDLLPPELRRIGLSPAGRLDKDTTGLLILTNDGELLHRIISPKKHVPKRYLAEVERAPEAGAEAAFEAGLTLGDGTKCLPARLERHGDREVLVTVHEGKYHQVKRMLAAVGAPVKRLHRLSVGSLTLPKELPPGGWTEIDAKEIQKALK